MFKILFLDRDGIINVDKGYIFRTEDLEFMDGIFEMLKAAKNADFLFIVITNQAGIARGMYTAEDVDIFHAHMRSKLSAQGIDILDFFFCPHHPQFTGACECRKPEPGMLKEACEKYEIDMPASIMIGDKRSDVQAGKNAGVGKTILLSSQYDDQNVPEADFFAKDLYEATEFIKECSEA